MKTFALLSSLAQIKLLADPRRLEILRLLMAQAATLSQLGRILGKHPAWVQHHVRTLERIGLVQVAEVRMNAGLPEKLYRARAGGFAFRELILPQGDRFALVFAGSHDLVLEWLAEFLAPHLNLLLWPVGSLDGLADLRLGLCHFAGAHLCDANGEYNTPFVSRMFPDRPIRLVTLAHRTQGWMTWPGNPRGVLGVEDLLQPGLRFLNRNPGSGTRLWLDMERKRRGIPADAIPGYSQVVSTHVEAAEQIACGQADVALGLEAAARQQGLDFVPLFQERYDLVVPEEQIPALTPLLEALHTAAFRQAVQRLGGYDVAESGMMRDVG
ncbi:MAG: helix-turn-helix domain-containing protein [Anaerolineales bacterium]|nr:helix-turn-helix domain-containing protein [Anaerolineales bacterium]MCX7756460.1 helix-turn-helix domain-containing protein [Anaerolineales bacterium]MDW8278333.1 substrate-binding domain-containing protein [Anaerolineales bacterium]